MLDEIEHELGVNLVQPVLSYGSWTGGDMDGHPEVGADTLASALSLHRSTALRLAAARPGRQARPVVLATPPCACRCPRSSRTLLAQDAEEPPTAAVLRRPHREWEPLRTKLGFVHHRLAATR